MKSKLRLKLKDVDDIIKNTSYEKKIELAQFCIDSALKTSKRQCVAFSGGKNSLVVLHMVLQKKNDVIVLFNNTTNEMPETLKYVRWLAKEWKLNFYEVKPETNFWKIVDKYGFPHHRRYYNKKPKCCYYLKIKPAEAFYKEHGVDCVFTGISAYESRVRKICAVKQGMLYKNKKYLKAYPIIFWSDDDVWKYIEENNLPVNPAYKKYKINRIGCIACTGFINWQKKMQKINPRLYEYVMRKMGQSLIIKEEDIK